MSLESLVRGAKLSSRRSSIRWSRRVLEVNLAVLVQEKAVQDRLIRETQDALLDKVALAELNMFEAKFAGYTTKLEHQQILNALRPGTDG